MTFPTAGSDRDLRDAYTAAQVQDAWGRADTTLARARSAMEANPRTPARRRVEHAAREALGDLASGLNWAEDTPAEQDAHDRMDTAGRWVRTTFGCQLHQDGKQYFQTCPVALGHNRIGLSMAGCAKRTCSLCGDDLSECEHLRSTAHVVPGGNTDLGWCRVCLSKDTCGHSPDNTYRVGVVAFITDMELNEVSIVGKPAHPDARFRSVSLSNRELEAHLGPQWTPGMPVICDRCLTPCAGLTRHEAPHL